MPVDPLEEARERLEADLEAMAVFFRKLSKWKPGDPLLTSGDGEEWANTCAQAAALIRAILAELDRRSPPTREGGVGSRVGVQALVDALRFYADPASWQSPEQVNPDEMFDTPVRADAYGYRARAALAALAAAPPPPDVSRGLDREEVARIIDPSSWAVMDGYLEQMKRQYKGENAGYDPDAFKHKASLAKADAIIALSAPAGGVETQYSSKSSAFQPALGGKPPLDEPESAAGAWRPMTDHPPTDHKVVLFTEGGRAFVGYWGETVEDEEGRDCATWAAAEEGQHPPCWTDGLCWASNEDDWPSDPPVAWCERPAPPEQSAAGHPVAVDGGRPARERAEGDAEPQQ